MLRASPGRPRYAGRPTVGWEDKHGKTRQIGSRPTAGLEIGVLSVTSDDRGGRWNYRGCRRIGRASALAFAREGASVVIGDIDGAGAEETVSRIREGGGDATWIRIDVTQSADVRRMVQSAVQQHGGLDYAFNNAGFVGSTAGIVDTTEEEWHQAVALNLTSVWLCMNLIFPRC